MGEVCKYLESEKLGSCCVMNDEESDFLIPHSSHKGSQELQRCPRLHLCSSWPWWQLSGGSPETISRPHPLN